MDKLRQPKITSAVPLLAGGGPPKVQKVATPALNALYYGVPEAQVKPYEPSPRELMAQKLQQQFERFMPAESAKKGARKITGYTYPAGLIDVTPVGLGLAGGEGIGKGIEAAGAGEYGRAALEGLMGAANIIPGEAIAAGAAKTLGPLAAKGMGALGAKGLSGLGAIGATAWHGTPHIFPPVRLIELPDGTRLYQNMAELAQTPAGAKVLQEFPAGRFDISKIGTGEGAQAYGHGLYFAESPDVAKTYRANRAYVGQAMAGKPVTQTFDENWIAQNALDEMGNPDAAISHLERVLKANAGLKAKGQAENNAQMQRAIDLIRSGDVAPQGALYKVDIPDEAVARMLDWDKPLSEQHPDVQRVLARFDPDMYSPEGSDYDPMEMGQQVYNRLAGILNVRDPGPENASAKVSAYLQQQGIPGIKYLDEGSRAAGEGTRNFVLFSDELPRILEVNEKPTGALPWRTGEWKPTQE